jgi:hypothetical protein
VDLKKSLRVQESHITFKRGFKIGAKPKTKLDEKVNQPWKLIKKLVLGSRKEREELVKCRHGEVSFLRKWKGVDCKL